jgi:transcriptional regulator of met regulon
LDSYKEFLISIPAKIIEIIGENPDRKRRFVKNIRQAAKYPLLVEWQLWYYNPLDIKLREPQKNSLTKKEQTLAAYHALAHLHDIISNCAPEKRFFNYNDSLPFEDYVFFIQEELGRDPNERPSCWTSNSYPYENMSRLKEAIEIVKADLERKGMIKKIIELIFKKILDHIIAIIATFTIAALVGILHYFEQIKAFIYNVLPQATK